jgi:putative flippase GtrA
MLSLLKLQASKFTIVGTLNFGFTFLVLFSLLKVIGIVYWVSFILAWGAGVVYSYILNSVWVFKPSELLEFKKDFLKYLFANAVSFIFNLIALSILVENTHFDPFLVQLMIIPFIVIFNFITSKFWSLRPKISSQTSGAIEKLKIQLLLKDIYVSNKSIFLRLLISLGFISAALGLVYNFYILYNALFYQIT